MSNERGSHGGGRKVCFEFRDTGRCRRGTQCRYIHQRGPHQCDTCMRWTKDHDCPYCSTDIAPLHTTCPSCSAPYTVTNGRDPDIGVCENCKFRRHFGDGTYTVPEFRHPAPIPRHDPPRHPYHYPRHVQPPPPPAVRPRYDPVYPTAVHHPGRTCRDPPFTQVDYDQPPPPPPPPPHTFEEWCQQQHQLNQPQHPVYCPSPAPPPTPFVPPPPPPTPSPYDTFESEFPVDTTDMGAAYSPTDPLAYSPTAHGATSFRSVPTTDIQEVSAHSALDALMNDDDDDT